VYVPVQDSKERNKTVKGLCFVYSVYVPVQDSKERNKTVKGLCFVYCVYVPVHFAFTINVCV
jgi:glycerol-3-phosphate cytidylyltransferase-like family protein